MVLIEFDGRNNNNLTFLANMLSLISIFLVDSIDNLNATRG